MARKTNLKDKENNEIFEGSILYLPHNNFTEEGKHKVYFHNNEFVTANLMFNDIKTANKYPLDWMIEMGAVVIK